MDDIIIFLEIVAIIISIAMIVKFFGIASNVAAIRRELDLQRYERQQRDLPPVAEPEEPQVKGPNVGKAGIIIAIIFVIVIAIALGALYLLDLKS